MTTENQNQEMELDDLKVQYQSLQEKFNQQEIVNNDLIHEILHTKITGFRRRNMEIMLTYGLLAAAVCWSWYRFDLRLFFMVMSVLLFALIGLFEWLSCRKVLKINTEDSDIQSFVWKMECIRTRFSIVWMTGVFALCLWLIWFLCEIDYRREIAISYVPLAFILILSIILIICNMDRLVKMSDELLAQTLRLNGSTVAITSDYHRSGAYWTGIAFLALNLFGLFLKLGHLPFGNLTIMVAGVTGLVFVLLTGRHLVRVVPDERLIIRMVEVGCMILVVSLEAKMFHFPLSNLLALVGLSLLLAAALVRLLKSWQGKRQHFC